MPEFAELLKGYRRFRESGYPAQKDRYERLVKEGQSPKLMVIACSDSRVDPAQIFDVDPGEIFVVRNIAALVPPYQDTSGLHGVSAALEFATEFLKVRQIVIMGHGRCGGCKAALTQELRGNPLGEGGFVSDWIALLDDARTAIVAQFGTDVREAEVAMEQAAVKTSLQNLRSFPNIAQKEGSGELTLRGVFFAISDGHLHILNEKTGFFGPVT